MKRLAIYSIIRKDIRGITVNTRLFASIWIVPIIFTVFFPSIFVFSIHMVPDDPDFIKLLEQFPASLQMESTELSIIALIANYILPVFFLMIPIMTASIMAASAFVGEKERRTLETLLYCPLTLKEIFRAKVLASFLLSMFVSLSSFLVMLIVLEVEVFFLMGSLLVPGISWLIVMLLIAPAISLIAITLIVRGSAKAKSVEEAQQSAVFLVIPIILIFVGQFSGVLFLGNWVLLGLGILCAGAAFVLLLQSMKHFTYEKLLK